jgi:hemerythrin-like domain-containing protein
MSEPHRINLGVSLLCVHRCITRGIQVSIQHNQSFMQTGFPDGDIRSGYHDYVKSLVSVVHAHHLTEDELSFPYFKEIFPQAPFDALFADHRQIVPLLGQINQSLDRADADAKGYLNDLNQVLAKLAEIWHPHIQIEESHFTPQAVDARVSLEDQHKLAMQIGEHTQKYAVPDYLTVPFYLYNLSDEDRQYAAADMPPVVTQQLVPQVWKTRWAPMIPFLLV